MPINASLSIGLHKMWPSVNVFGISSHKNKVSLVPKLQARSPFFKRMPINFKQLHNFFDDNEHSNG